MKRILKELTPFVIYILIIVALLLGQAMTDLALPDYMSNIVNVGIQQKGIERAVPDVIRASEMDKLKIFLAEEENKLIDSYYKLINKDNLTKEEYNNYWQ